MARSESLPISLTRRDPVGAGVGDDSGFTVVWLDGEHDASTTLALASVIERASELDDADVVVDLSGVTFMDASTIGILVGARNRLATRSLSLQIRAPSRAARRILELCGLSHLEQTAQPVQVHTDRATTALGTWVDVPLQPVTAGPESRSRRLVAVADVAVPAMAEADRAAS